MVAELAVFGAIGTTAGLISTLTTTVETLNKKYHDFVEGADRLNYSRNRMIVIEQDLQNWRKTWLDKHKVPFPTTIYELFWGYDSFETIKVMLNCIQREDRNIRDFLYCEARDSPRVSKSDQARWEQILNQELSGKNRVACEDGWLKHLIYALFQGTLLKERIDRLKDELDLLISFSKKQYWMLLDYNQDPATWIDPDELKATERFQVQLTGIAENMKNMYDVTEDSREWRLVLGNPSPNKTLLDLADGLGFSMNFVAQDSDTYRLLTIEFESAQSPCFRDTTNDRPISFEGLGVELSIKCLLQKTLTDANLRKANQYTLGIVATKLVRSIVLLYKSPWTIDLCTCGILIADTMEMERDICTFRKKRGECHDRASEEQRFLRLAVALAELCMTTPIKPINSQQEQYSFEMCGVEMRASDGRRKWDIEHVGTNKRRTVQEEELLRMVHRQTGSRAYKLALESCIALARSEMRAVRPERIRRSVEEIVKPVEDYWSVVSDERIEWSS